MVASMSWGSLAALLLAGIVSAAASEVPSSPGPQAPPLGLDLRLDAPAACPGADDLHDEITRLLGPIERRVEGISVHGRITPSSAGWVLELELGTLPVERRRVEARDCVVLVRAAALMAAVALEPVATSTRIAAWVEPGPAPAVVAPEAVRPPAASESSPVRPVRPAAAVVAPRRGRALQFVAAAFGGVGVGLAPRITGVVHGELGLGWPRLQILVGGLHGFARTRAVASGIGIRASSSVATLHALARVPAGPLALELGGGLEAGAIVGAGTGPAVVAKTARAPWVALAGRVGLTWPRHGRVALGVRVDAVLAVARPGIALQRSDGPQTVFRTPTVLVRALGGVVLRLP